MNTARDTPGSLLLVWWYKGFDGDHTFAVFWSSSLSSQMMRLSQKVEQILLVAVCLQSGPYTSNRDIGLHENVSNTVIQWHAAESYSNSQDLTCCSVLADDFVLRQFAWATNGKSYYHDKCTKTGRLLHDGEVFASAQWSWDRTSKEDYGTIDDNKDGCSHVYDSSSEAVLHPTKDPPAMNEVKQQPIERVSCQRIWKRFATAKERCFFDPVAYQSQTYGEIWQDLLKLVWVSSKNVFGQPHLTLESNHLLASIILTMTNCLMRASGRNMDCVVYFVFGQAVWVCVTRSYRNQFDSVETCGRSCSCSYSSSLVRPLEATSWWIDGWRRTECFRRITRICVVARRATWIVHWKEVCIKDIHGEDDSWHSRHKLTKLYETLKGAGSVRICFQHRR